MSVPLVEASVVELGARLARGEVTAVELVAGYLARIAAYDHAGPLLNSCVVVNEAALAEAAESDERRANGTARGPLDGIPYVAKDSFLVHGLTAAAGSPAFADLVAQRDAFTIERLRAAGAICLALTNMPPMANGGMQRGLYGRAESPYNADYLAAPFASGSSNGSGTALAASFAAFALAEETWSSGRGPAALSGLCCYTPSRGVISVRGNWPLVPTMDVVVPYARTMADLLLVLDAIVADDTESRGDFWRVQPWVPVPLASEVRPVSYPALSGGRMLRGARLGVPRLYIGGEVDASSPATRLTAPPTTRPADRIETRPSVLDQWAKAWRDLEAAGATVVEVDLPVVTNYESRGLPDDRSMVARGFVPQGFADSELWQLAMWGWDEFLSANADPALNRLVDVEPDLIFPTPPGSLPGRYDDHLHRFAPEDVPLDEYVHRARRDGVPALTDIPHLPEGLRGLEKTRRLDFEDWLDRLGLDAIVFPAVADVGPADSDTNPASAERAWRNGIWVANGNLVLRHLGIPCVQVPIGLMGDIRMPVGLTFAGRAYDDARLLTLASEFERAANGPDSALGSTRVPPTSTPELAKPLCDRH